MVFFDCLMCPSKVRNEQIWLIDVCISDGCEFSSTDVCISDVDGDIRVCNEHYLPPAVPGQIS